MVARHISRTTRGVRIDKSLLSKIRPNGNRFDVWDSQLTGFHLRVGSSGSMSYALFYRNSGGKQRKYTIGRTTHWTPKRARSEARRLIGEIASGRDPAAEKQSNKNDRSKALQRTVKALLEGSYWDLYLSTRRSGRASKERIQRAWKPFLEQDISTISVESLAAHRSRRLRSGIKPQTLNRDRSALFTLFSFAVEHGIIARNPLEAKTMKPLETEKDERVRYLGQRDKDEHYSIGERARFMAALENQSYLMQGIVGLALSTGMRRGEIYSLRWDQVDLRKRRLCVSAANSKSYKTRQIPMNDSAREILRTWRNRQGNVRHLSGLVFPSPHSGQQLVTLQNAWNRLVAEAEIEDFRFHDCRHDFASRLVQAGVPLYEVSKLLGHSSLELTQRYAHLDDANLLKAAKSAEI